MSLIFLMLSQFFFVCHSVRVNVNNICVSFFLFVCIASHQENEVVNFSVNDARAVRM